MPFREKWQKSVYNKAYYQANKDTLLSIAHRTQARYRSEAVRKLGGKCAICGITDIRLLTINHLNGGGSKDLRTSYKFYRSIITGTRPTQDLDIRCFNHNVLYEYERGVRHAY